MNRIYILLLPLFAAGNAVMLFAWYWHLRSGSSQKAPLFLIVLMSWGIAFFEYCIMVPSNRIGAAAGLTVAQLRVMAEAVSLLLLIPFSIYFLHQRMRLDFVYAALCILGAVYFVNRSPKEERETLPEASPSPAVETAQRNPPTLPPAHDRLTHD